MSTGLKRFWTTNLTLKAFVMGFLLGTLTLQVGTAMLSSMTVETPE